MDREIQQCRQLYEGAIEDIRKELQEREQMMDSTMVIRPHTEYDSSWTVSWMSNLKCQQQMRFETLVAANASHLY